MSEVKAVDNILPPAIVGKFNIALTQAGFQKIQDELNKVEYTEENIPVIAEILKRARAVETSIIDTHKKGKEPSLNEGRQWDRAKNDFLKTLVGVVESGMAKYSKLCTEVDNRKREQKLEEQRIEGIKNGIEVNSLQFSQKIAACTTTLELTRIESFINLEKTRKDKYQEFLPDAVEAFTKLNVILKKQKDYVRQMEILEEQKKAAEDMEDDKAILEIQEHQEKLETKIEANKITVQEEAINQSMSSSIGYAKEVLPDVRSRKTWWKSELVDAKEALKKAPDMLDISLNPGKAKEVLKTLSDSGQLKGKTEMVLNGIRYYEVKTF